MSTLSLSNLHVRANLLSAPNYQQEMMRCSVFELRDINQRNPGLVPNPLPDQKQQEWRESLFWGDSLPSPVPKAWAERLVAGLADAVRQLEERPTLEVAIECLIIARELYNTRPDGPLKLAAADMDRRICVILARDEFRHTPDMIDQRLESILGRPLLAPPRPIAVPTVPVPKQVAVDERPRPPKPIPAKTDIPVAVVPERPAPAAVPAATSTPVPPAQPKTTTPLTPCDKGVAVPERSGQPQPLPAKTDVPVAVVPERPAPAAVPAATSTPVPPAQPRTTATIMIRDKDLKRLVQRWPTLPDHVKKCVIMLLDAADSSQSTTE